MKRNRFKRFSILATCLLPVVLSCNVRDTPVTPRAGEHICALKIWLTDEEVGASSEHCDLKVLKLNQSNWKCQTTLVQEQSDFDRECIANYLDWKLWPAFGCYIETNERLSFLSKGDDVLSHYIVRPLQRLISDLVEPLWAFLSFFSVPVSVALIGVLLILGELKPARRFH